jgi:hypothetical protein
MTTQTTGHWHPAGHPLLRNFYVLTIVGINQLSAESLIVIHAYLKKPMVCEWLVGSHVPH